MQWYKMGWIVLKVKILLNIPLFCRDCSSTNINAVNASFFSRADISSSLLWPLSVNIDIAFTRITDFCLLLLQLNVSTEATTTSYGWKCTCTSCEAKHSPPASPKSPRFLKDHHCLPTTMPRFILRHWERNTFLILPYRGKRKTPRLPSS